VPKLVEDAAFVQVQAFNVVVYEPLVAVELKHMVEVCVDACVVDFWKAASLANCLGFPDGVVKGFSKAAVEVDVFSG
jgi:hypothetical protein